MNRKQTNMRLKRAAVVWRRRTREVLRFVPRIYSLVILFVICYLTFGAVRYLVVSLMVPSGVPEQIAGLPTRLTESVLRTERGAFPALELTEVPRTPVAHYHRMDAWIEPDPKNDCTRSGCHAPLPHTRRKEVRAFLNMHATSIHCGVCHMTPESTPIPITWYSLPGGESREAPSILKAYGLLTSPANAERLAKPDAAFQKELVTLIRTAASEAKNLPALNELARHLSAVRPESTAFGKMLEGAREALPRYFRGEYGSKLAQVDRATGKPILGHPGTAEASAYYLEHKDSLDASGRADVLKQVHPRKREAALTCSNCHTSAGGLIDFRKAGYPEERVKTLFNPIVTKMIEHINQGTPFNYPGFMSPAGTPTTAPAE